MSGSDDSRREVRRVSLAVRRAIRPTLVATIAQLTAIDERLRLVEAHLRRPLPEPDEGWQALAAATVNDLNPDADEADA
jgi:hypothetical protein